MGIDYEQKKKKAKDRIIKEIESNKKCQKYFAPYDQAYVQTFINSYAQYKAQLELSRKDVDCMDGKLMTEWSNQCWYSLKEIQYKKLFDLQCLWRADKIGPLEFIQVSVDFIDVGKNILDYRGMPQITKEEVKVYQDFLRTPEGLRSFFIPEKWYNSDVHEDYHEAKKYMENNEHPEYFAYYQYHNKLFGGGRLMELSNIREEREKFYIGLADKEEKKNNKDSGSHLTDNKFLYNSEEELIRFAEFQNDKAMARYLHAWMQRINSIDDKELDWALLYLGNNTPDLIPIYPHDTWRTGIIHAARTHMTQKVIEWLPAVFEEYEMKRMMNIAIDKQSNAYGDAHHYREKVRTGRALNGEPKDFDF